MCQRKKIMKSNRLCPICQNAEIDLLHTVRFCTPDDYPMADHYRLACCSRCGFVYADTTVKQEAYDRFYKKYSKYEDKQVSTGGGSTGWDKQRLQTAAEQIATHLGNPNARILDIGCANGGLLQALSELGYTNLVGVDPSPACVWNVTERLGLTGFEGSLFALPPGLGQYDCVILSHVLEHINDIAKAMEAIRQLVRTRGLLYVEVPDATRYHKFVYAPYQDLNTEHINHFSPVSLTNLIGAYGFTNPNICQRTIQSSIDTQYPVIGCFSQYQPNEIRSSQIQKDHQLRVNIEQYITKSGNAMADIDRQIAAALPQSTPVIVWGVGQLAYKLLVETKLNQADIRCFVDSNPINQAMTIRGKAILAPQKIIGMPEPILVATTLHQEAIVRNIRENLRLSNEIITLR